MFTIEYLRHWRIAGFAIFDFVASYLGMLLLAPFLTKLCKRIGIRVQTKHWLWLTLPLGVFIHLISGAITPLTQEILNLDGDYLIKFVLLFMVYMGLKDIRKIK